MLLAQSSALPEWDSEDAKRLKDFLESDTGKKAVAHTLDVCPELLDGEDVNKTLVRNGKVDGFNLALFTFFSLTTNKPAENPAPENYPSLDDERAWTPPTTPKT